MNVNQRRDVEGGTSNLTNQRILGLDVTSHLHWLTKELPLRNIFLSGVNLAPEFRELLAPSR